MYGWGIERGCVLPRSGLWVLTRTAREHPESPSRSQRTQDEHFVCSEATGGMTGRGGLTLPFVAEVRGARKRADKAVQASVLLQRALSLETSMGLVGKTNTSVPEQVRALFREVHMLCPEALDPSLECEEEDRAAMSGSLRRVVSSLRELAADQEASALALHALQHQQQHALVELGDEATVQEMRDLGEERTRIQVELVPLDQQVAVLEPTLARLHTLLGDESGLVLQQAEVSPLAGPRLLARLTAFLTSVGQVMEASGIEADMPPEPSDASVEALGKTLEELHAWSVHLTTARDKVRGRARELHDRYAAIQERLLEALG